MLIFIINRDLLRISGYKGDVSVNGKPRNRKHFMKQLSYIMQDDHLQPLLTVIESMEIASKLKNCTLKLNVYHQVLVSIIFIIRVARF